MPPLTCWTVLRLDSTPITPGASAALASGAVAAPAVKPPRPSAMVSTPAVIVLAVRGWAARSGPPSAATDTPEAGITWLVTIDMGFSPGQAVERFGRSADQRLRPLAAGWPGAEPAG